MFADADLNVYVIEGESAYDIVKQFRHVIGRSYIPPKFAFGFGQSRWGYTTKEDFRKVAAGYRENHIPLDMIYMDIDYMDAYKDFTVNPENFPDFPAFVKDGRFPFLQSAYNVNWEINSNSPFTSCRDRFVFPSESSKIRIPSSFLIILSAICMVS